MMADYTVQAGMLKEDKVGLAAAIVLHVALAGVLTMQFAFSTPRPITPPRMTVSLATEVSLESTAPEPVSESRAATAPILSDEPAPVSNPAPAEPVPSAVTSRTPPPPPPPPPRTRTPARTPPPRPAPSRDRSRPDREPAREPAPAARAPATPKPPAPAPARNSGGSRIGDNFLTGQGESAQTDETRAPAATFGRSERAALSSAITRQLRPYWEVPTGVDAEKLVSTVSWRLNQDGSLLGRPTCRNQASSITDSNRPQAGLHCERAIRAVQRAAPFNLPEQFYSQWDDLEWQFDRRL